MSHHHCRTFRRTTCHATHHMKRVAYTGHAGALRLAEKNQELYSKNSVTAGYWEGAVTYEGSIHSQPVRGVGYLEMTGYGQPLTLGYK